MQYGSTTYLLQEAIWQTKINNNLTDKKIIIAYHTVSTSMHSMSHSEIIIQYMCVRVCVCVFLSVCVYVTDFSKIQYYVYKIWKYKILGSTEQKSHFM